MDPRGCSYERIHRGYRPAAYLAFSHDFAPSGGNHRIDCNNSALKPQGKFMPQPFIEPVATATFGQPSHTVPQLRQGDDAQENPIFIGFGEPRGHPRIRPWPNPLGHNVRVDKKAHRSSLRGPSLTRSIFTPEPRSGD